MITMLEQTYFNFVSAYQLNENQIAPPYKNAPNFLGHHDIIVLVDELIIHNMLLLLVIVLLHIVGLKTA